MLFAVVFSAVAALAGGVAAITGFGIGSLLTPVLALETGTKLAVAAVGVPHLVGTTQRFWMLRRHVDRRVLLGFGVASAAGGLAGALAHTRISSRGLGVVFGALLVLAGVSELTGWLERVRWGRRAAWAAGVLSGALGGLVGNQGGIRSAAMLGFKVPKEAFVATATAVALLVDGARLPVYLVTQGRAIAGLWPLLAAATGGRGPGHGRGHPGARAPARAHLSSAARRAPGRARALHGRGRGSLGAGPPPPGDGRRRSRPHPRPPRPAPPKRIAPPLPAGPGAAPAAPRAGREPLQEERHRAGCRMSD